MLSQTPAIVTAIALSVITLFGVGVYSAKTLVGGLAKRVALRC